MLALYLYNCSSQGEENGIVTRLRAGRPSIRSSIPDSGKIYLLATIQTDSGTPLIDLLNGHRCLFAWG